jgi:hypothetical protein
MRTLVFEIRLSLIDLEHKGGLGDQNVASDFQFRIVTRGVKTHETLWALAELMHAAVLQSNCDKNFEQSLAAVSAEVQRIAGPATAVPAKN